MIADVSLSGLKPGEASDPKAVAAKVQSMFTEVMLKAMEDSVDAEDGLFGGSASSDIYRGMLNQQLAESMSSQIKSPLEGELEKAFVKKRATENGSTATPSVSSRNISSGNVSSSTVSPDTDLPVSGVVSSPVGWRKDPIDGTMKYHAGTDIAAPPGTPIRAVADGTVIESGPKGSYGNAVVIQADDGRKMLYAHNKQNLVQVGDRVSQGDQIGEVGATGRATGPHVHFEVKF